MKTCIIHIGMHKTGTTSLQSALKGYDDGETHYCGFSMKNHSVPLVTLFKTKPGKYNIHKQFGRSDEKIHELREQYRQELDASIAATNSRMVISGEGLSVRLGPREIANLVAHFRERFDKLEVICYIRDFPSYSLSSFQQSVRTGAGEFYVPRPNFQRRFEAWCDTLEEGELTFVKYTGETVEDFFTRYGLQAPQTEQEKANTSLSGPAMALLFAYNRAVGEVFGSPEKVRKHRRLIQYLNTLPGGRLSFSEEVYTQALADNSADLDWMEKVAGFSLRAPQARHDHVVGSEADMLALARDSVPLVNGKKGAGKRLIGALESKGEVTA